MLRSARTELLSTRAPNTSVAVVATRSPSLKELNSDGRELSSDEMLSMMHQEPRLVRRPLVRIGGRLLVGASIQAVEEALVGNK